VGDVEAMAAASVAILRDGARWDAMSRAAAADARRRFALDQVLSQYEALYTDALR
jgi:glycosyltransferase involved in cell wall biosynthesis